MDLTTALTGMLFAIILSAVLFTVIASLILLRLYKRAVLKGMTAAGENAGENAGKAEESAILSTAATATAPALQLVSINQTETDTLAAAVLQGAASSAQRRSFIVFLAAGTVYALVLTAAWMITAGGGFVVGRFAWLFACFLWPAVLLQCLVAVNSRRQRAWLLSVYGLLLASSAELVSLRNPELAMGQLLYLWCFTNIIATALACAVMWRPIRAVAPMVFAFMLLGVAGAMIFVTLVGESENALGVAADFGAALGISTTWLLLAMTVMGFLLLALPGYWLLTRLGAAYRNKQVSDQMIMLDALMLLFAVLQSFTLSFEYWGWILTGPVAFVGYRSVVGLGYRLWPSAAVEPPVSLLLLRVFALGRRSETLYDMLGSHWRRVASIDLIAGPDLLSSTLEPHEFLDFVGGRLSRQFINRADELDTRIKNRDLVADRDGRYRVNEFFCRDDTWQATVARLAPASDVVLMDLRSFSRDNQGCYWELQQLLQHVALARILLLVDDTTDTDFLQETLYKLWRELPQEAINLRLQKPVLQLFMAAGALPRSVSVLVSQLLATAEQGRRTGSSG